MPEVREARKLVAAQGEGIRQSLTHAGEVRVEEDMTVRALLRAILFEQKKTNMILAEAFKSELGRVDVSELELEE